MLRLQFVAGFTRFSPARLEPAVKCGLYVDGALIGQLQRQSIREGASIPELAEELGHSSHMTLTTYSHVINELRGAPPLPAVEEVAKARREVDMRGLGMALREPLG